MIIGALQLVYEVHGPYKPNPAGYALEVDMHACSTGYSLHSQQNVQVHGDITVQMHWAYRKHTPRGQGSSKCVSYTLHYMPTNPTVCSNCTFAERHSTRERVAEFQPCSGSSVLPAMGVLVAEAASTEKCETLQPESAVVTMTSGR